MLGSKVLKKRCSESNFGKLLRNSACSWLSTREIRARRHAG